MIPKTTTDPTPVLPTYHEPTFRTWPATWVKAQSRNEEMLMQLCESYEDGRWEGFCSILDRRPISTRKH